MKLTYTQDAASWKRLYDILNETYGVNKVIEKFLSKIKDRLEEAEEEVDLGERKPEYLDCAKDFFCFAKHLKVWHPTRGLIHLDVYPYHKRLVEHYQNNRFSIVKKFRQGAFTTYTVAYLLWLAMFKPNQQIVVLSKTDREAIAIGDIVQRMIAQLPQWLHPRMTRCNDHLKEFGDTGSRIRFVVPEATCGMAISHLFIDEAAFIEDMDKWWKCMWPQLSCGGNCIVVATPNGKKSRGKWFYEKYTEALEKKNNFSVFEASYKEHPDYNNA
jgi:hypothetical protein